jgi:hypothetical protein
VAPDDELPDWFSKLLVAQLGNEEAERTLASFASTSARQRVLRGLACESDRCVGIVAPVFVEEELSLCLQRHFWTSANSGLRDRFKRLFQPSQALGSFSVKIDIGYFLGIYGEDAWSDLVRIKDIRNMFAHNPHVSSFDEKKIAGKCDRLRFVDKYICEDDDGRTHWRVPCMPSGAATDAVYEPGEDLLATLRKRFMISCQHFVEMFTNTYPQGRRHIPHF